MRSLDTNVILRFLVRDVADQSAKAVKLITHMQCYVTDVVFTETAFVLEKVYEAPRENIATVLRHLLALPNVACNEGMLGEVIDLYGTQPALSIIDCYAAVEAEYAGFELATFDKKLLRHGGSHVVEP